MRPRHLLGLTAATAAAALALIAGLAVVPATGAIPPCGTQPVPPPGCPEPPPPPPPPAPGPLTRQVVLHEASPHTLPAAKARLDEVLDRVAPANRSRQRGRTVTLHLIPQDLDLTELPPWAEHRGDRVPDENPNDDYKEKRLFDETRGFANGCDGSALVAAVGEEQVVPLPTVAEGEGYNSVGKADLASTLVHETGHLVRCLLTPTQQTRLERLYQDAFARYPARIVGREPAYTVSDAEEYWAEGTAAWFQTGSDASYSRSWLRDNDRGLHDLLDQVYDVPPAPRFCKDVRATAVLASARSFTGGDGQDVVVGSPGSDVVSAGKGDDIVCGQGGTDTLAGGLGTDHVEGGPGNDEIHGDAGNDDLLGDAGDDSLDGEGGNDRIDGSVGDDDLDGGPDTDVLWGGDGPDHLFGDTGDDRLYGGNDDDRYDGGPGQDWLSDHYFGGADNHPTDIGDGADTMYGGRGNDTLNGEDGDDVLDDRYGTDELFGGPGFDQLFANDLAETPPPKVPYGPDQLDGGQDPVNYCTADRTDVVRRCFAPGTA